MTTECPNCHGENIYLAGDYHCNDCKHAWKNTDSVVHKEDWQMRDKAHRLVAILAIKHEQTRSSRLIRLAHEWGVGLAMIEWQGSKHYDEVTTIYRLAQHAHNAKEIES